jgi:hypothetical protein
MKVNHKVFYNIRNRTTERKNTGTKHRNNLLKNMLSKYFLTNPNIVALLDSVEPIFNHLIDSIRDIKKYKNPMIHKNFYDFN